MLSNKKQLLDFAKLLLEKRSLEQNEMLEWFQTNLAPVYKFQFKEDQDLSALIAQSYAGLE